MNKSINLATFFLVLTPWVCMAQLNSMPKKIVLNHKIGYYCTVRNLDHSILLTRFNLESPDRDSIYIFDKPSGVFESHPLVWDVLDSFIFQIRIRTSADKSQYSELRVYSDDKVRKHVKKGDGYDYIASQNTLYDNSLPLNSYIRRINNQEDTLTEPIYFDILAKPDSLLLYIYLTRGRLDFREKFFQRGIQQPKFNNTQFYIYFNYNYTRRKVVCEKRDSGLIEAVS